MSRRKNPYVRTDAMIKKIMKRAFPEWKGKEVEIHPHTGTINLASYWEGGSRRFYALLNIHTFKSVEVPPQSMFDTPIKGIDKFQMMPDVLVVEWPIVQGKRMTPTIHVHPDNVNQLALVEPQQTLNWEQAMALLVTRRYISSARLKEFHDWTGLGKAGYEAARKSLQALGLLKKNNALTTEGKNVASQWTDEYDLAEKMGVDWKALLKKTRGW